MAAAAAEARSLQRSARAWVLAGLVTTIGLAGFYYVARQHAAFSWLSAVLGTAGPRYLIYCFGIPMLFAVMLGVVFLLLDARHREIRECVADALDSRPATNLVLLAGRCIAVAGAAWLTIILALIAVQAWGGLALHFGWALGEPVQLASLAGFAFVDCFPALVVWSSLVCLFAAMVRNRLAVVLAALAVLCFHHWALFNTPIHLLPVVSLFPNFGRPVSDILPEVADGLALVQRVPWLLLAAGLLAVAASRYPRSDCGTWSGLRLGAIGAILASGGVGGLVAMALQIADANATRDRWEAIHRALADEPTARLQHIAGRIHIDPGNNLGLDLEMRLATPPEGSSARLVFSFNPGMHVDLVTVNGSPVVHRHDLGVLWVETPKPLPPGTSFDMALNASGVPNPRFAYLDSAIVPAAETWADSRLALLGSEASIFEESYVALMPGSRWLPIPGPNLEPSLSREGRMSYTVDLEVEAPTGWRLAGPGKQVADDGSVRFRPAAPLPEVAVFAAPFESFAARIENVDLELLVSPKHVPNVRLFAADREGVVTRLQWLLREARELGIPYPYGSLQVIEVPAQLRTFGGGWRMDSLRSLPGVALLREHGFPTARFDHPASRKPDANRLRSYFDQHGSHDLLVGVSRNLFAYRTSPQGDGAAAADFVLDDLVARLLHLQGGFATHAFGWADAPLVPTLPHWLGLIVGNTLGAANPSGWWRNCAPPEAVSGMALVDLSFDERPEMALCLLSTRGLAASRLLRDTLGTKGAGALLAELRRRRGGAFDATDLASSAGEQTAMLEPVIRQLLLQAALPGFLASRVEAERIADDAQGLPRYQARLHVRNDEPVPGFVRVDWGTARPDAGDFLQWHTSGPVPIPGNSSVEIGFVSSAPPLDVWLLSYMSKNRQDLRLSLLDMGTDRPVAARPLAGHRASEWRPKGETGIVVDDLDPGFSVEDNASANFLERIAGILDLGRSVETELDHGLPLYRRMMGADAFVRRAARRDEWARQEFASAWGGYRRTIARTPAGDGSVRAIFATNVSASGRWRLEYHLPDLTPRPRFSTQFRSTVPIGVWDGGPQGLYELKLIHNGIEIVIKFDAANAVAGWNELGTYVLEPGTVRLVVSNRTTERNVIVDAIRWTRISDAR